MTNNWIGILAGNPGAGKTHLAISMSEVGPCHVFDTEGRANWVNDKRFDRKAVIHRISSWAQKREVLKSIFHKICPVSSASPHTPTIIWDSGSDMINMIEETVVAELRRDTSKWHRSQWNLVYAKAIGALKHYRDSMMVNTVITTSLREIFSNNIGTGKYEPRISRPVLHLSDFILQFDDETQTWNITKNMWAPKYVKYSIEEDIRNGKLHKYVEELMNPKTK